MKRKKLILLTIVYICSLVAALAQSKWPAVQPEHDALMREFDRTSRMALVMADRLGNNRLLLMCRVNRGEFFMRYN